MEGQADALPDIDKRRDERSDCTSSFAHATPIAVASGWSVVSVDGSATAVTAATAAASTATAAAIPATTTTAATTAAALLRDIDAQGASGELLAVHLEGVLGPIRILHLDEREAA